MLSEASAASVAATQHPHGRGKSHQECQVPESSLGQEARLLPRQDSHNGLLERCGGLSQHRS